MTAVLEGVTKMDFLCGTATLPPTAITASEWIDLISETMPMSFGDIGSMYPIAELLLHTPRIKQFAYDQEVTPREVRRARTGAVPNGARFLHCGRLGEGPFLEDRVLVRELVLGKSYVPDATRSWDLYGLDVIWEVKRHPRPVLSGLLTARDIGLARYGDAVLKNIFGSAEESPSRHGYVVARTVLHHLYQALATAHRDAKDRMERIERRQERIAGLLGRTGYGPFLNANRLKVS